MAASDSTQTSTSVMQRIAVLVVHGIGEQHRFEHLESIASNFHKALLRGEHRSAHVEVRRDDESCCATPVVVRWKRPDHPGVELHFREVYWADLDEPATLMNWFKLVGWAIAMPGVRRFHDSRYESVAWPSMRLPEQVSWFQSAVVRLQLFVVSLLFLIMLISVDVAHWLLRRFSFSPEWLSRVRSMIYDHLGDVKLYQDWYTRCDENMEVHGERSRVAIRRRMVRVLVQTARDVHEGKLDGYYVISHSLGTIVAFNGLMEHGHLLPSYLSSTEWAELPSAFKAKFKVEAPEREVPIRAPWLDATDAIDRRALFAGMRGFLTLGSPLNKFATLWPALVPINDDPVFNNVPWINVADCQDIVAGKISLFSKSDQPNNISGLRVRNVEWPDQWTVATAHTRYWKAAKTTRLVDKLVPWLEGAPFEAPKAQLSRASAYAIFSVVLVVLAFLPLLLLAYMTWLLSHSATLLTQIMQMYTDSVDGIDWIMPSLTLLASIPEKSLVGRSVDTFIFGSEIVLVFAAVRHLWERWRFRPQRKHHASCAPESPEHSQSSDPSPTGGQAFVSDVSLR